MWLRRRRPAVRGVDARDDALAGVQLAALGLEHERLVVAEPDDVDDARAAVAVLALDDAGVGHLAAARRVERGLDELRAGRGRLDASTAATAVACSVRS